METFARCDLCSCYFPTLDSIYKLTISDAEGTFKTDMIICKECSDDLFERYLHERYKMLQSNQSFTDEETQSV